MFYVCYQYENIMRKTPFTLVALTYIRFNTFIHTHIVICVLRPGRCEDPALEHLTMFKNGSNVIIAPLRRAHTPAYIPQTGYTESLLL